LIAEFQPQLLLLDITMPVMDGLKLLERLSDQVVNDSLKVIMVTSSEDQSTRYQALLLGARDFIGKPVDPEELVQRVESAAAGRPNMDFILHSLPPRSTGGTTNPGFRQQS
jgi:DNA-binding response OmpR family regulator